MSPCFKSDSLSPSSFYPLESEITKRVTPCKLLDAYMALSLSSLVPLLPKAEMW